MCCFDHIHAEKCAPHVVNVRRLQRTTVVLGSRGRKVLNVRKLGWGGKVGGNEVFCVLVWEGALLQFGLTLVPTKRLVILLACLFPLSFFTDRNEYELKTKLQKV